MSEGRWSPWPRVLGLHGERAVTPWVRPTRPMSGELLWGLQMAQSLRARWTGRERSGAKPCRQPLGQAGTRARTQAGTWAGTWAWGAAGSCPRLRPPPALPLLGTLLPAVGERERAQTAQHGEGQPAVPPAWPPAPRGTGAPRGCPAPESCPSPGPQVSRGSPCLVEGSSQDSPTMAVTRPCKPSRALGGPVGSSFGPTRDRGGIPGAGWVWGVGQPVLLIPPPSPNPSVRPPP